MTEEVKGGEAGEDEGTRETPGSVPQESTDSAQGPKKKPKRKKGKTGGKKEGNREDGKSAEPPAVKAPDKAVEDKKAEEPPPVHLEASGDSGKPQESEVPVQETSTQESTESKNVESVALVTEVPQQPSIPTEPEPSKTVLEEAAPKTVSEVPVSQPAVVIASEEAKAIEVVPEQVVEHIERTQVVLEEVQEGVKIEPSKAIEDSKQAEQPISQEVIPAEEGHIEEPRVSVVTSVHPEPLPEAPKESEPTLPVSKVEEDRKEEPILTIPEPSIESSVQQPSFVEHSDSINLQDQSSTVAQIDEKEVVEEVASSDVEQRVEVVVGFEPADQPVDESQGTAELKPVGDGQLQAADIQQSLEEAKKPEQLSIEPANKSQEKARKEEVKKEEKKIAVTLTDQQAAIENKRQPDPISNQSCASCIIL